MLFALDKLLLIDRTLLVLLPLCGRWAELTGCREGVVFPLGRVEVGGAVGGDPVERNELLCCGSVTKQLKMKLGRAWNYRYCVYTNYSN